MQIKKEINDFLDYLLFEKGLSNNTIDSYKNDLTEFIFFLKKHNIINIKHIDKQIMLNYYNLLENKEFSKATLQRRYSSLNQFFKFLIKKNIITSNPMILMRRQKKELKLPKFLTIEEINKLLSVNNPQENIIKMRNCLILELMYSTGMRVSELCNLPIKSVICNTKIQDKIDEYQFITIKGKGQKERLVPIKNHVLKLLQDYIKITYKKGQKYLFPSTSKSGFISRRTIENIIKQTAILAGLNPENISPHTIRHSFATHLLQKGLDIREIQELLGHSSIDTTSIYAKINTNNIKHVLEKYHPLSNT